MCKKIVVGAADHRVLRGGNPVETNIRPGQLPGNFDVTCGGGSRPIPCHVSQAQSKGSGRGRVRATLQPR